uniref:SAG family member n=1 Tax=Eimeria tenella TaxID=5802 RepID=H9B918_EIMTE|nr:hypothetical protein [Eimeria tenella]
MDQSTEMFRMNLATFLSVSLLWLSEKSSQAAAATTVKYTAKLGSSVECLGEVNNARQAAGLANFIKATNDGDKISDPGSADLTDGDWKEICEYLVPTQPEAHSSQAATETFKDGTYAFKALTAEQPNCTETIDYWKAAYKNFTGLPPSKKGTGKLYENQDNVSFVALYNASSNATADCRVVTCTQKTSAAAVSASVSSGDSGDTTKLGYALICKTMPTAFGNGSIAPFTQEQWDKIKYSLTGSASIAVPSLVALVIVAFGITAL